MDIEQYYLTLRNHFRTRFEGECFFVSMAELTDILSCTRRNVQFVLNKMSDKKLIEWKPGRGRGNQSKLTFLEPLNAFILTKSKRLALEGKLDKAWKLIDDYSIPLIRFEFSEWLYRQLGFQQLDTEEDVLRFPFYRPVLDLDPTFVHRRTEAHWINQLFNPLVSYNEKTKSIVPALAHYWESNEDFTIWRFYLRKGIRFHHGKLLTSDDVAFTFKRIMNKANFENIKAGIKTIKIIGKHTIEFVLKETDVLFIHYLCSERCSILPTDFEETIDYARLPIGTGPFRIEKNNDSGLMIVANDHYFEGRPHLDRVEMWVWPSYEENRMLRKDDIYFGFLPAHKESHTKLENWEKGCTYFTFNLQKQSVLQDENFRKAIHYALDRERMIKQLGIRGIPANCFFPEQSRETFYNEANTEKAITFLRQSSYQNETLLLYTYEMPSNERNARWIQSALQSIGIRLEIVILPVKQLAQQEVLALADFIVAGEVLGFEEDISLIEMFLYSNGFIHNHLGKTQRELVTEKISLCKQAVDKERRLGFLNMISESIKNDYHLLFLYHVQQTVTHNQSLQGIMLNSFGKVDYKNVWLKDKSGSARLATYGLEPID